MTDFERDVIDRLARMETKVDGVRETDARAAARVSRIEEAQADHARRLSRIETGAWIFGLLLASLGGLAGVFKMAGALAG